MGIRSLVAGADDLLHEADGAAAHRAICSNLAFFAYGLLLHLMPVLLLRALLMPINVVRLLQATKVKIDLPPLRFDLVVRVWSQARGDP